MTEIVHKELSYKLCGIFFEVHNRLGRFCEHNQYCDACELLLKKYKIPYKREITIPINFESSEIKGNRLDFLIKEIVPIDVKAKKFINTGDYVQIKRYLKATNRRLGIIVNFRDKSLKPKRILNSKGLC